MKNLIEVLNRLKLKWGLDSYTRVFLICMVFSLAGFSVLFLRKAFFHVIGFDESTPFIIKSITYLLTIFPSFQVLLLIYGFLLGQFSFFWDKEKKMVAWVLSKFHK